MFDYPYRPRSRDWSMARGPQLIAALLREGEPRYAELISDFGALSRDFLDIPDLPAGRRHPGEPCWVNGWFPALDAISLCGLLKSLRPPLYLEVDSGNSTRFARWAIERYRLPTRIVSIDPEPRADIDAICDQVVRMPCEDVPEQVFGQLTSRDVLFVDNSHRAFPNSDVTVFFLEIFPALPPGLVCGIHDISLPGDYPESIAARMYNEQYLLATYLLGRRRADEVVLPNAYLCGRPALLAPLASVLERPAIVEHGHAGGGGFWIKAS